MSSVTGHNATVFIIIVCVRSLCTIKFCPSQQPFSVEFFVGALVVVVCFILVTVLDHFGSWDPLWALIKTTISAARNHRYTCLNYSIYNTLVSFPDPIHSSLIPRPHPL